MVNSVIDQKFDWLTFSGTLDEFSCDFEGEPDVGFEKVLEIGDYLVDHDLEGFKAWTVSELDKD